MPASTLATLVTGLPPESRVVGLINGVIVRPHQGLLQVQTIDTIRELAVAIAGGESPTPMIGEYVRLPQKEDDKPRYRTGSDFEEARAKMIGRINGRK